jgi:uncharacterized membrane protein YdfJ with MMPL/SSD domain
MLSTVIKIFIAVILLAGPIITAIMYGRWQVNNTKKRIQSHIETKKSDIIYLSTLPQNYKKPELVVMKDKKILVLNSRKKVNVVEYH